MWHFLIKPSTPHIEPGIDSSTTKPWISLGPDRLVISYRYCPLPNLIKCLIYTFIYFPPALFYWFWQGCKTLNVFLISMPSIERAAMRRARAAVYFHIQTKPNWADNTFNSSASPVGERLLSIKMTVVRLWWHVPMFLFLNYIHLLICSSSTCRSVKKNILMTPECQRRLTLNK